MAVKADGSVVIDTLMNTEGFQTGVADMKKGYDGISKSLMKIGKLMVSVFLTKKLIQFGEEAIELGSDLSEVQNVVDVTFGNINKEINQFAQNAIEQFGLSETAAKRYSSTMGAMLKSMGFSTRPAADMSKALTGLAGDMASFYNLSADDAFAKIRAGISGETEPLKQLGINLSVANLEQYALTKGITKSYNAMNQQEQALLRYNYLLSVTSDAQGDFARTSESWANQTRILSERFNALKATIGQGLINTFTPALKLVNTLLSRLQTVANAFRAFTELLAGKKAETGSGYSAAADGINSVADAAQNAAVQNEAFADSLGDASGSAKELNKELGKYDKLDVINTQDNASSGAGEISGISVDFGQLSQGDTILDSMSESMNNMLSIFEPLKEAWSKYGGSIKNTLSKIKDNVLSFGKKIGNITLEWFQNLDWEPLLSSINNLFSSIEPLIGSIGDFLADLYESIILPFAKFVIETALPKTIDLLSRFFTFLSEHLWIIELIGAALIGAFAAGKIVGLIGTIKNAIALISGAVSGLISILGSGGLGGVISSVITALGGPLTVIIGAVIALLVLLVTHWDEVKSAMIKFDQFLQGVFEKDWSESFGVFGDILNGFFEVIKGIWTAVKGIFQGVITFISGVFSGDWKKAWEGISQIFSGIWNGIVSVVKGMVNMVIGVINALISGITAGINTVINALNMLNIDVPDWVPKIGGKSFGFNIQNLTAPQIPYLAKGAVIPPNAPFMAMLGDNKKETEVVSPLSTIEQALENVMARYTGSAGSHPPIQLILNGRVVAEAVWDEERKRYKQTRRPVTN